MKNGKDETLLQFPCDFSLKIVAHAKIGVRESIIAIIHKHFPEFDVATNLSERPSKGDKYIAYTVTIHPTNKIELDALYLDLTKLPDIEMVL